MEGARRRSPGWGRGLTLLSLPSAVLLDMDGTLVDSDAAVERAWTGWAAEHDVDPDAVLAIAHGSPPDPTVRRMLPDLDDRAVARSAARQMDMQYDDLSDVVAARGVGALLAALERLALPWAVVTSADVRLARARLGAAGIPAPPLLVTVEDVHVGKPDPECYRIAAARLGVDPARCLVVEDAGPGVEAGRAAGMTVAGLRGVDADVPIAVRAQRRPVASMDDEEVFPGPTARSVRPANGHAARPEIGEGRRAAAMWCSRRGPAAGGRLTRTEGPPRWRIPRAYCLLVMGLPRGASCRRCPLRFSKPVPGAGTG